MTSAAADIIEQLGKIQCVTERFDAIAEVGRDSLILLLDRYGFGRSGTVPSDWRTYFDDDELRRFVCDYAEQFSPAL